MERPVEEVVLTAINVPSTEPVASSIPIVSSSILTPITEVTSVATPISTTTTIVSTSITTPIPDISTTAPTIVIPTPVTTLPIPSSLSEISTTTTITTEPIMTPINFFESLITTTISTTTSDQINTTTSTITTTEPSTIVSTSIVSTETITSEALNTCSETLHSEPLTLPTTVPFLESESMTLTSTTESITDTPSLTTTFTHTAPTVSLTQLVTPIPSTLTTEVTHVTLTTDRLTSTSTGPLLQETPLTQVQHEEISAVGIGGTTSISRAAGLARQYIAYMEAEAKSMENEQTQMIEEIGTLQQENEEILMVWEKEQTRIQELQDKYQSAHQVSLEAQDALDKEKGKSFALELKLLEQEQLMARLQKEADDKIERIKWEHDAAIQSKGIELNAVKKAQILTQKRLKQAQEDIDEFMANPTVDPTTESSKSEQIAQLKDQLATMKTMNEAISEGLMQKIQLQEYETEDLRAEVVRLGKILQEKERTYRPTLPLPPPLQPPPTASTSTPPPPIQAGTSNEPPEALGQEPPHDEDQDKEMDFYERIEREKDSVTQECMRWEKRILESACITYLTPDAVRMDYHQPTLPYPLLKHEVQLKKAQLLPQLQTNALGGYENVPVLDLEVTAIQENQPRWRAVWIERDRQHKFHYLNAPQDLRIDPTFCPVQRRRNWELFRRFTATERQNWLNYPVLPSPEARHKPTEKYMLEVFSRVIRQFKEIPDLSCIMLVKIVRMLQMLINAFNDMDQVGTHWTTYFEGPRGLAWDLQSAPSKEILMGLYARCIFLPSHYMVTFEEAFYTGFFEIESKIFSMMNQDPRSRYVAFMRMEVERPLRDVIAEAELQQRINRFKAALKSP